MRWSVLSDLCADVILGQDLKQYQSICVNTDGEKSIESGWIG